MTEKSSKLIISFPSKCYFFVEAHASDWRTLEGDARLEDALKKSKQIKRGKGYTYILEVDLDVAEEVEDLLRGYGESYLKGTVDDDAYLEGRSAAKAAVKIKEVIEKYKKQ